MRNYETMVILNPELAGDELTAEVEKLKGFLAKINAEILKVEEWGVRKLAYLVKKHARGIYCLFVYRVDPAAVSEFERRLRIEDAVLKFQTVGLEDDYEVVEPEQAAEQSGDEDVAEAAEATESETEAQD
ncbi:MAG: 30S ribosomal protein S6 [Deltaproteobacteria bacterium]|nr:MAG: 30S ribosomal protein S6 [Deltaproteobacteria bacterium]